ncbi:hypothetical protein STEG23_014334 [Scotinomys teguina]
MKIRKKKHKFSWLALVIELEKLSVILGIVNNNNKMIPVEGHPGCFRFLAITNKAAVHVVEQKMKACGLLPGWYGLTSQYLLTALQMFQNPDQLQDNWLKDEASQTAPVKIGPSS